MREGMKGSGRKRVTEIIVNEPKGFSMLIKPLIIIF